MPFKDKNAQKAWSEKYYADHREEIIAQKHRRYQDNKEKINAERREEYQDPEIKAKKQEISNKSRLKNRDKILEKNRTPRRRFQFLVSYAKKRELTCLLSEEQYAELIGKLCDYCENQLGSPTDSRS